MDDQLPPPPYSRHNNNTLTQPPGLLPSSAVSNTFNAVEADEEAGVAGLNAHLISPPPSSPPVKIISRQLILQRDTNPDEIQPPPTFSERNVAEQDWFTFRNQLFPTSIFTSHQEKSDSKGRDEIASTGKETGAHSKASTLERAPKNNNHDADYSYRKNIHKVVREWNSGFFEPRGLLITVKIVPTPSSSKRGDLNSHSPFGQTVLTKAAGQGDYNVVEELLLQGADPDTQPFNGSPALYVAAQNKHSSIVSLLLQHGAKVDTKPSVLHLVASTGDVSILSNLLKYGADPNHKNWTGSSPLFDAAGRSDLPVSKLLLAYGANPDYSNTGFHSALYYAIKRRDMPIIQLLLSNNADPNQRPWSGQTCLHLATSQDDIPTAKALLSTNKVDVDIAPPMTDTPLITAIAHSNTELVDLLLSHGAKINIRPMGSQPPIFLVASKGYTSLLRLILEKGGPAALSDIDSSPAGFPSALHMAIHRQDLATASLLLSFHADPNAGNSLSVAVDRGDHEAVKLLLDHGANPNGKPTGGQTAFYSAASKGDVKSLELLCEKGADVGWKPTWFSSALWTAVVRGDGGIVRVLLRFGADAKDVVPGGEGTIEEYVQRKGEKGVREAFEQRGSKIEDKGEERGVGIKSS